MDYFLDLKNNEHVIRDYLRGFSLEDISFKHDIDIKIADDLIDLYNRWYN